jgi:hypothetical protein
LSLLDQRNSKGSILHPDALSFISKRKRDTIKSPLDGELLQTLMETFIPLHESVKPGIRFVDKYLDRIDFQFPPKGHQNVLNYHGTLEILDPSPNTLHFITTTRLIETYLFRSEHITTEDILLYRAEKRRKQGFNQPEGGCLEKIQHVGRHYCRS